MADLISDSYTFGGGVKLQAQYKNATPTVVGGSSKVPWTKSGSYSYHNFNLSLGTLTVTKCEILRSGAYNTWYITCTGTGTWTGSLQTSVSGMTTGSNQFTLKPGRNEVDVGTAVLMDDITAISAVFANGESLFGSITSATLKFKTSA